MFFGPHSHFGTLAVEFIKIFISKTSHCENQHDITKTLLMFVCCEGALNRVELRWFSVFPRCYGLITSTAALAYSRVKSWLPSLAWSEGIVWEYTQLPLGFLVYIADRLLTGFDVKV